MMGHKDKQGTFNVGVTLHSDMEVLLLTTQTPPAFHEHWDSEDGTLLQPDIGI